MGISTPVAILFAAIASASALSPPLPGVIGALNSPNTLVNTNVTIIPTSNLTDSPPQKYILKFHTEGLTKRDGNPHSVFHKRAQSSGLIYSTRQTYNNEGIFVGLSLTLHNGTIEDLKNLENVAKVWPVKNVGRPTAVMQPWRAGNSDTEIHPRDATTANTTIKIPHISGNINPNNPHKMAGVDKVQAMGYYGAGVKIAVIDTGVDYLHPSLGGCFGKNCKISFGYDFVGDDYPTTTVESSEPLTQCILGGHGTHVMGIIGMEDPRNTGFGLLGVAPKAELGMYRVFGCSGDAESDIILSAMLQAQTDGANVISMSLGAATPDEEEDPYQSVTTALAESGVAVFAANGNDAGLYGDAQGIYYMSAPGSGPDVFAVGSVDNTVYPVTYEARDSNGKGIEYSSVMPLDGPKEGLTVLVVNYGSDAEEHLMGCYTADYESAAANVTDPSKYILAVLNGGCTSDSKGEVAKEYGFNYIISYFTGDWDLSYIWGEYDVVSPEYNFNITPIVVRSETSNTILQGYERESGRYKLFFDNKNYQATSPTYDHGGFMSNFSSWGPTLDTGVIKPQLSAPGANILSTWPLDSMNNGYAILSGTSMSTPFMAACFAVLKEAFPKKSNKDIMALMQNSGTLMDWYYDKSILSPPLQQGAGMINVHNALTWESVVMPTQVTLDPSANGNPVQGNVTIYNRSKQTKLYTFSHKVGGLAQWEFYEGPSNQLYPIYAAVKFDQKSISIKGGESAVLKFTVNPPYVEDSLYLPIYGGYIIITNNGETYTVPYIGQPWDTTWANTEISKWIEVSAYIESSRIPINEISPAIHGYGYYIGEPFWTSTRLTTNATFSMGRYGYFGVLWQLADIVDQVRFDLVPANTSFTPTIYGYDHTVVSIPKEELIYPTNATISQVLGAPVVYNMKEWSGNVNNTDGSLAWWQKTLPVDSVPNADYRILMRVLPLGGDYNKLQDWQSWLSAILTIDRSAEDTAALAHNEVYDRYVSPMSSAQGWEY